MSVPAPELSIPAPAQGAVILCGGLSTRMGRDKASLPFGGETLLGRTIRLVSQAVLVESIVCVAAEAQRLPGLPRGVTVERDPQPELGPLAALAWGLAKAAERCEYALVTGCDSPLMEPALIELLFSEAAARDCVATSVAGRLSPLPGVYSVKLSGVANELLTAGQRSLRSLLSAADCRVLGEEELRRVDPALRSLINCNDEHDYRRALALLADEAAN